MAIASHIDLAKMGDHRADGASGQVQIGEAGRWTCIECSCLQLVDRMFGRRCFDRRAVEKETEPGRSGDPRGGP